MIESHVVVLVCGLGVDIACAIFLVFIAARAVRARRKAR
jgi:hypothetical protein